MSKRVRNHTNPFTVRDQFELLDYASLMPEYNGIVDLEIGFGRGVFFQQWATRYPSHLLLGIEVRKKIVDILVTELAQFQLKNTQAYRGEGKTFLEQAIHDHSLDRVFVFHPDPWHKKRHHKRRVVNKEFLDLISKKLKPSGQLFISTDVDTLWTAMTNSIEEQGSFKESPDQSFWSTDYISYWDSFSMENNRNRFYKTFII